MDITMKKSTEELQVIVDAANVYLDDAISKRAYATGEYPNMCGRILAICAFQAGAGWQEGRATPSAYAVFAENGNVICFSTQRDHPSLEKLASEGHDVVALGRITAPDVAGLVAVPQQALRDFIEYSVPGPYGVDEKWSAEKKILVAAANQRTEGA